jgi:hypothetical protein
MTLLKFEYAQDDPGIQIYFLNLTTNYYVLRLNLGLRLMSSVYNNLIEIQNKIEL